jgi:hypothetical protein
MSSNSPLSTFKGLQPFDQGVIATGILTFIVSFFPYYGVKASGTVDGVHVGGASTSYTAWHSYSTLGLLLILLGSIVYGIVLLSPSTLPELPVSPRWIAAGVCALGALLYVIRLFTLPHHHVSGAGFSASEGVKWGGYLLLLIVLVHVACSVISALSSDEEVPWQRGASTAPPAA